MPKQSSIVPNSISATATVVDINLGYSLQHLSTAVRPSFPPPNLNIPARHIRQSRKLITKLRWRNRIRNASLSRCLSHCYLFNDASGGWIKRVNIDETR